MILGFMPFELLCNILFYSEFCVFLDNVLTPRISGRWRLACYPVLIVVVLFAGNLFGRMTVMRILTLPVLLMAFNLLFYRDKRLRCIFAAWLVPVIIFLSEMIVVALLYNTEMLNARLSEAPLEEQILCWSIELLSGAVLYWITSLVLNRVRNRFSVREMLMYTFFPVSQFMLLYGWINASRQLGESFRHQILVLVVLVVCLVADTGLFASMIRLSSHIELETENRLLAAQIEDQRAHYAGITAQYESIRAMRHDIAKHISAMDSLLVSGRNEEAAAYVSELRTGSYDKSLGICEHPVVDAYLYSAIHKSKENHITLDAVVSIPTDISVTSTDLVCTFGNLLDNAFEACLGQEGAVIKLRVGIKAGCLLISTENPLGTGHEKKVRIHGLERGLGLRVLKKMAEKYDGSLRYYAENDTFRTEVTYLLKG